MSKMMSANRSLFNLMSSMTDQRFQRIASTTALHQALHSVLYSRKRFLDAKMLVLLLINRQSDRSPVVF